MEYCGPTQNAITVAVLSYHLNGSVVANYLHIKVLPSITRRYLIECAVAANISVREVQVYEIVNSL